MLDSHSSAINLFLDNSLDIHLKAKTPNPSINYSLKCVATMTAYSASNQHVSLPNGQPNVNNNDNVGCGTQIRHTLIDCGDIVKEACIPSRKKIISLFFFILGILILGLVAEMRSSMAASRVIGDTLPVENSTIAAVTSETALWTD